MDILIKVFVYGTLKSGEPNHYWITDVSQGTAQLLSVGETIEKYPLVTATRYNIPFLVNLPGEGYRISGEIYAIDEKKLKHLDILEDYPRFYDRMMTNVTTSNGSVESCWIYVLKEYPEDFLTKHKLLKTYTNSTDAPYVPKSQRGHIKSLDDLDY